MSLKNFKREEKTEPRTSQTIKERDTNKSYAERLNKLKYCKFKKSKDKITRDGKYCSWFPNHKMEGKLDGMYMSHPSNKHDEQGEEKQIQREA